MGRRSDSVLYARLTGVALAIVLVCAAAVFFVACFLATHITVALGRLAEPGLGRRTAAVRDGALAGVAVAAAWTLFVGAVVAALAGDVAALPYGLLLGAPLGLVVGWQFGHWQTAVSWAHAPGATVLGDHRQGRLFRVRRPYTVTPLERVKHMGVTGATGTGKSTLLRRMIVRDIRSGAGVCVIDPKDDLVDRILGHIPAHRVKDVILFDATDRERPLGINPFAGVPPEQRSLPAARSWRSSAATSTTPGALAWSTSCATASLPSSKSRAPRCSISRAC